MKSKYDEMLAEQSGTKKKVRRRVKKKPDTKAVKKIDKTAEKRAKKEAAEKNRVYLSTSSSKAPVSMGYTVDKRLGTEEKHPSRFRAQSADWKAGMEETVPNTKETGEQKSFVDRIKSFTPIQWASGFMAVVIFVTSMTSTVVYANYQGEQKVNEAYEVLAAYEETAPVMAAASTIVEEEIPLAMDEPEVVTGKVVSLVLSSVEKDLKIKVVDEEDNLLKGIPWKASVTDEDDKSTELVDDDKDGIIHAEDMAAGNYSVALISDAATAEYTLPSAPMTVAVKAKVEYKVIQDIKDLIKKESEINVAAEDTGGQQAADVESAALKDTVEFVESTKTASGKKTGYIAVDKNTTDLTKVTAAMSPSWVNDIRAALMNTIMSASTAGAFGNHVVGFPSMLLAKASVSVNGLSLDKESITLAPGEQATIVASTDPSEAAGSVSWSSSGDVSLSATEGNSVTITAANTSVASSGSVTAIITSSDNQELSKSCSVTITAPAAPTITVSKVAVSPTSASLEVSKTTQLTATVTYSDGSSSSDTNKVTWTSSDSTIATVDQNSGLVTAVKAGSATITATSTEDTTKAASCTVTVSAVAPFTLSPTTVSVEVGATTKLTPSATATYKSSDEKIATVATDGTVKGIKAGTATITATNAAGKTADCKVTVTDTGIALSGTAEVAVGKTTQLKATLTPTSATVKSWTTSDKSVATVSSTGLVTGIKAGKVTITAEASTGKKATITITVKSLNDKTELVDKKGNKLYVRTGSAPNYEYRRATYADYNNKNITSFYIQGEVDEYVYTGWQTIDGLTYFFKKDHTKVTGEQVIGGVKYNFASDGSLTQGSGTLGIDVSKYQPSINWASVKASGISYVIIRCGYRGSSTGVLVEDPYFRSHIKGAKAAGLKVGVYFFTTAVTEAEAVEEASMCASLCSGYGINYPIFMDCESSPRAGYNGMSAAQRTSIIKAFCNTVKSAGYTPGVYANKTWLTSYMNASELSAYKIWLAQYNSTVTYRGRYDLWQFTSKGSVNGISGSVDMNQSYLGY